MKVIESIISIGSFQKKFVIIKELFQSEQLKQQMVTIGVEQ